MIHRREPAVPLPAPETAGTMTVPEALARRASIRSFSRGPLSLEAVSQLLWAAQGLTRGEGLRSVPSAGALYPLFVYLLSGEVESLPTGIYKYRPDSHDLVSLAREDRRRALARSAVNQEWIEDAGAVIAITAVYERTTGKYGRRGRRYVHMEVGHAVQSVYLQATALGLGTVLVGAFDDDQVHKILGLPSKERPLGLMPVGQVDTARG